MTHQASAGNVDMEYAKRGWPVRPDDDGATTWFNGDLYSVKLSGGQTGGQIGLVEAMVPPGDGPAPHVHAGTDVLRRHRELEFLSGDKEFNVAAGDVAFVPRGNVHRFHNAGIRPATLVFIYTPGGAEGLIVEGGDEPQPGVRVQPWGPDRIDERMLGLLAQYDTVLPPQ